MKHTTGERALVLAMLTIFGACADPPQNVLAPSPSRDVIGGTDATAPGEERAALTTIARLVARALDNEPARQRLKRDMRAAPFREHKLELTTYLRSKDGRALLDRMAALGGGESEVFATLGRVRPLELYVPVAEHREKWTGKADIIVVSQLEEFEPIVAFDEAGRGVTVDRQTPPAQPVVSIVPVETDFSKPMPALGSRNERDQNGDAIGTLEPAAMSRASMLTCLESCDTGGGGSAGPPPSSSIPPGLYLEFSRILDAKEPWVRGDPEIEVHVHGPNSTSAPTYGDDRSCSGEHAYDYKKVFNQDGAFWEGRVMLFSEAEVLSFVSQFKDGFHILFWEDDNEPCVLRLDSNTLVELLRSTSNAFGTVALKVVPTANWAVVATVFLGTLFSNAGVWLQTNDDFLGAAVEQSMAGYAYPGNTHVLMDGTTLNGRVTIVYRH